MASGHKELLEQQKFHTIKAGLQQYRLDDFIRNLENKKGKNRGSILPFIRGLRFSSLLIYAIRELLIGSGLTANWGHIIDEDGELCSRECDIIIHKEGYIIRWNGDGGLHPVMDFKFIEQTEALAVISCKSYLQHKSHIEVEYCADLRKYVDKVWLFAECCPPEKATEIRDKAVEEGYEYFWHLYSWDKDKSIVEDSLSDWTDFVQKIKDLKNIIR
jgi:hypothetical protein